MVLVQISELKVRAIILYKALYIQISHSDGLSFSFSLFATRVNSATSCISSNGRCINKKMLNLWARGGDARTERVGRQTCERK